MPAASYPQRIVCLTEETTETLYLLGQGHRVVGVSGYTVRPPEARQKPRVSAFISAKFDKIQALNPDLVLAFSDLQADLAAELIRRGIPVVAFNQRTRGRDSDDDPDARRNGWLSGRSRPAGNTARDELDGMRAASAQFPIRPRVFFEEWDDPLISGIRWVEELVTIAGGTPIFPELECSGAGQGPDRLSRRRAQTQPGRHLRVMVRQEDAQGQIVGRPGWSDVTAVARNRIYEIPSTLILQPGPAALTDGVRQIHEALQRVASGIS